MDSEKHAYIGVDAIIRNSDGKILLMKRNVEPYKGYWGLITGLVKANENVDEALKRVAGEEVGIDIVVDKYTGRYYDEVGRHPTKTCICLPHVCRVLSGEPQPLKKCDEARWFSPEEIYDMDLAYDHKQMLEDEGLILIY
jgi:8-oxo-dGTP diphosphatase